MLSTYSRARETVKQLRKSGNLSPLVTDHQLAIEEAMTANYPKEVKQIFMNIMNGQKNETEEEVKQ